MQHVTERSRPISWLARARQRLREMQRRPTWIDVVLSLESDLLKAFMFLVHRVSVIAVALASALAVWPEGRSLISSFVHLLLQ
jgi:hypothetical protein